MILKVLAEKMNKQAETEALNCLEQAVEDTPAAATADPKKIARGASRDSYKNATTPPWFKSTYSTTTNNAATIRGTAGNFN